MTYLEIDEAIVQIARQKYDESKSRLNSIPKENSTERKALQLEHGMYTFCSNAGLLINCIGSREGILQTRTRFLKRTLHKFPSHQAVYRKLNEEEQKCFVAAWQAELFIRDQWLLAQRAELAAAEVSGDAKSVFEFSIKIGAVESMFGSWETWRKEHGVYPHLFKEDEA
ncbi:MAG: hypothetical protein IJZ80_02010 [Clostridia bacterium]|nr:hypothetical protein [Clostridia bacterium]